MVKFKMQYVTYEKGEFTNESELNLSQIFEVVAENTETVYFKHSTSIKKNGVIFYLQDGNNYFKAEHLGRNGFTVFYCNDAENKLYKGNFYLHSLKQLITLFYEKNHHELTKKIPKTSIHEKKLIKTYIAEPFVYSKKRVGIFNFVFYSIFPLIILVTSIFIPNHQFSFGGLLFSIILFIPLVFIVLIHQNYKAISNITAVKISVGTDEIIIWEGSTEFKFSKLDIEELLIISPLTIGVRYQPFDSYGYTKIRLKNGKLIIITSMIIDVITMEYKLWTLSPKIQEKFYPYIRL